MPYSCVTIVRVCVFGLLLLTSPAVAEGEPADAKFCQQYAATVATASEDGIHADPACVNPSAGVHGNRKDHIDWCLRTPRSNVEGASVHIRRLVAKCSSLLVTPEEYGGYAIMGAAQMEVPYGNTRGWEIKAAFSGRLFMYCVAVTGRGKKTVRLGVDQAMPGDSRQWQLAVQVEAKKDWQGRLEIDGKEPSNRAGADVSGSAFPGWTIAWLNMGQLDALKNGKSAVLRIGKTDFDFGLDGIAAAIFKLEECRAREGVVATNSQRRTAATKEMAAATVSDSATSNSGANSQVMFKLRAYPELCIRNIGGNGEDSADIVLAPCSETRGTMFLFDEKGSAIRPQDRKDQCLFINQLPDPPDYVITIACDMARNRWHYTAQAGQLRGDGNRCLSVEKSAFSGAKLISTPCRAKAAQQQFDIQY